MSIFLLVFLVFAFLPVPEVDGWAARQMFGIGLLCVFVAVRLAKRFHWTVGLCFITTAAGCIAHSVVGHLTTPLLFACVALTLYDEYFEMILPALFVVALGDAVIMIFRGLFSGYTNAWWVLTTASLDAAFLAVVYPILLGPKSILKPGITWVLMGIFSAAIIISRSNTGFFTLLIVGVAYATVSEKTKTGKWIAFTLSVLPGSLYLLFFSHKFLDDNSRYATWKIMMGWWKDHVNWLSGTGPGTYWAYAAAVQPTVKGRLLWMHNDWLQQLFTHGFSGFIPMVLLYAFMLKRSFTQPVLFSMVVGYGVVATTQYPNHVFFFQVLGMALIYQCFVGAKCQIQ